MSQCFGGILGGMALTITAWTVTVDTAAAQEQASVGYGMSAEQAQQVLAQKVLQETFAAGLTSLHDSLGLTPRQDKRWRAFLEASFGHADPGRLILSQAAGAPPLERARAILVQDQTASRQQARAVGAMEALYQSLRPAQQAQLDDGLNALASLRVTLAGR